MLKAKAMLQIPNHRSITDTANAHGPRHYSGPMVGVFDWRQLLRHTRLIALSVAICFSLAMAYVMWRTPLYTATVTLLIDHKVVEFLRQDAIHAASNVNETLLHNQVALLRSEAVAVKVIDNLGLDDDVRSQQPAGTGGALQRQWSDIMRKSDKGQSANAGPDLPSNMDAMSSTLISFKRNLLVEAPGRDHTITIQFSAPSPQLAAMVANEVTRVYLQDQVEVNERAARAARSASASLRERLAELGTSARVLTPARPSWKPTGVGSSIVFAASVIGGLMLGFAGAFICEMTGRRIYTPQEASWASGAPYLAGLPWMRERSIHRLKSITQPTQGDQNFVEQQVNPFFWALEYPLSRFSHEINRLSIALTDNSRWLGGNRRRSIGLTCLNPGEGTTVVAANLAQVLSKRGLRVLLVDAVPHTRGLSRGFFLDEGPGVIEVVGNESELSKAVHIVPSTGLHILPLSAASAQQAMGCQIWCQAMEQIVNKEQQYDYIIVDLPPIGLVPDAVAAVRFLDSLVLVVERGVATMDLLAKSLLSAGVVQDKLIGVVMNKIKRSRWQAFVDGEILPRRAHGCYVNEGH